MNSRRPKAGDFSIGSDVWPGLSKLIEEMGEVQQVVGKLIATGGVHAHWDGTDLYQRLTEELGDLEAAIQFVVRHCGLDADAVTQQRVAKYARFVAWHREQATHGQGEGDE